MIYVLYALTLILSFYGFAVWCNFKVLRYLRQKTSITSIATPNRPSYMDIQNQLSRTLIAQGVIPLFTFAMPITLIVISVVSPMNVDPGFSSMLGLMITYVPTGDALSVLFFLRSYRKRGISFIKNGIRSLLKYQTTTVSTTVF